MAGNRKGKKNAGASAKIVKTSSRGNGRRNDRTNSNAIENTNPRIQVRGASANAHLATTSNLTTRGRARIIEDDAIVEMEAEGQNLDFVDSNSPSDSMDSGDEQVVNPINLNPLDQSTNNNATIVGNSMRRPLEDGEVVDENPTGLSCSSGAKRPRVVPSQSEPQPGTSQDGMDLKSYVDQKFNALAKMVELERELSDKNRELDLLRAKGKETERNAVTQGNEGQGHSESLISQSELTIYRNAVEQSKRGSSSSEELIDTSNEERDMGEEEYLMQRNPVSFAYEKDFVEFSEREIQKAKELDRDRRANVSDRRRDRQDRYEESNRFDYRSDDVYRPLPPAQRRDLVGEKSKRLVNEAENAKARIYEVPGEFNYYLDENSVHDHDQMVSMNQRKASTAEMDEDYRLVASHIDHRTRVQILNHEYVDFSKLLPRSKLGMHDDGEQQFMQIVNKGGMAGFMSISDRNNNISSYIKWEQAFRVFCDIYSSKYPGRITELIQYNHTIHVASQSYLWENVYMYDIEVRKHMATHPSRNWGIILNMAWTMCIKDRYYPQNNRYQGKGMTHTTPSNKPSPAEMKQRKPCIDYNKGKCTYGSRCRYDHRCGTCSKFGHGTHICRKMVPGEEKNKEFKKE